MLRRLRVLVVYVLLFHFIRIMCDLLLPNVHVANLLRGWLLGHFFGYRGRRVAVASGCVFNAVWDLHVGSGSYIAHRCWLNAAGGLRIGEGVILSPNVVVATTAHSRRENRVQLRGSRIAPVAIGDGVWVASNSVLTRGVNVGSGAVVGAGSVVVDDVPENAFVGGNPARFIRQLPRDIPDTRADS